MKRDATAGLALVAIFIVLILLNIVFLSEPPREEENEFTANRSSYRATPYGTLAFYALLEEMGYPVVRFERPFTELKDHSDIGTLLIISPLPRYNPSQREIESLADWVQGGRLVIIIDRDISVNLGQMAIRTSHVAESKNEVRPFQPSIYVRGVSQLALSRLASRVKIDHLSATEHIGDQRGAILADAKAGQGRVIVLTDPYVVANNGISERDNLELALNLLGGRPPGRIAFDEFHNGYGAARRIGRAAGGVIDYFRGTPVPWMMAQLALIALLVVYSRGRRFARPLEPRRERRTANLEFVSSMANIIRLARASDLAMQSIYWRFRAELCRYCGLPTKSDNSKIAAAIAARAKLDDFELLNLLSQCEEIAGGRPASDAELLEVTSRIRDIQSRLFPVAS
jgi:hypothetical protein